MATTIAHPRSVRSGPSGKTVAGFLVGVLAALAVGYGITNAGQTVDASSSSALGADEVLIQRATDFAAQQSMSHGANQIIMQKAVDYAALQARVAERDRMLEFNDPKGWGLSSARDAQLGSQIEFLKDQWNGQQLEHKNPGPVE